MKKKSFLVAVSLSLILTVGTVAFLSNKKSNFIFTQADDNPYVLNLNRGLTGDELNAGQVAFNTSKGNPINFNFDSSKASAGSGLISLASDGYFYNDTKITGITKIEAVLASGSATVIYGNAKDALYIGSASLSGTDPITVNLSTPSDYFKITNV